MESVWDWLSLTVFAGLAVLYLQRSVDDSGVRDRIVDYFPPAIACAVANYAGNKGYGIVAVALLVYAVGHIYFILKPFPNQR